MLHDVDDYKIVGIDKSLDLSNAKTIMNVADIDKFTQQKVLEIISSMGYSKLLRGIRPKSLEGAIVSDADMCDAIGANGLLRVYSYSSANGKPFFDRTIFPAEDISAEQYTKKCADSSVCHIFEKILKLKAFMITESGKQEAIIRHQVTIDFLRQLFTEENAPEWIAYLETYLNIHKVV